ncbi:MAG: hypothetical protein AAF849_21075 [Bacteroidota bacterium]
MEEITTLLEKLGTQERRDLSCFLNMPSNEISANEWATYKYALAALKAKKNISKEDIFRDYFGKKYKEQSASRTAWQTTKYKLLKAISKFCIMNNLESSPQYEVLLAQLYHAHDMKKNRARYIRKAKRTLDKSSASNRTLFKYQLSALVAEVNKDNREKNDNLSQMKQNLDTFFLEQKLRCICEMLNRKSITGEVFVAEEHPMEWIEKQVEAENSSFYAKIQYHYYKLLIDLEEKAASDEILKMLEDHAETIAKSELRDFYTLLLNCYGKRISIGKYEFTEDYIACINLMLKKGIISKNEGFNISTFFNAIKIALAGKDTQSARAFYEKYEFIFSLETHHKLTLDLIEGSILLHEGRYEEAYKKISLSNLKDYYHHLAYFTLSIKIDYAKNRGDKQLIVRINTHLRNIKRQKRIKKREKERITNLLITLRKIYHKQGIDLESLEAKIGKLDCIWLEKLMRETEPGQGTRNN